MREGAPACFKGKNSEPKGRVRMNAHVIHRIASARPGHPTACVYDSRTKLEWKEFLSKILASRLPAVCLSRSMGPDMRKAGRRYAGAVHCCIAPGWCSDACAQDLIRAPGAAGTT